MTAKPTTFYGFNQKLCECKPVFSARTINQVDTESIAFISRFQLNTVGSFSDSGSFLIYGPATGKFKSTSAPQELALSGDLSPAIKTVTLAAKQELGLYIVSLGGDNIVSGDLTIVWPSAGPGAAGRVRDVYIVGKDLKVESVKGTGVQPQALNTTNFWHVTRNSGGTVASQNMALTFSGAQSGNKSHLFLYFVVPVA